MQRKRIARFTNPKRTQLQVTYGPVLEIRANSTGFARIDVRAYTARDTTQRNGTLIWNNNHNFFWKGKKWEEPKFIYEFLSYEGRGKKLRCLVDALIHEHSDELTRVYGEFLDELINVRCMSEELRMLFV